MHEPPRDYNPHAIDDETKRLSNYWNGVHDEAEFEISNLGFPRMQQPGFTCPPIDPKALSNMDLIQYGEAHMRYVAWLNYSENTLAYIKSMLLGIKRQMDELHNRLRLEFRRTNNPETGRPFSVDDAKALAEQNPRYIELLRDRTKLESMKELMDSHAEAYGKITAVISRHIELRKLEIERQGTGNNIPGRAMYGNR